MSGCDVYLINEYTCNYTRDDVTQYTDIYIYIHKYINTDNIQHECKTLHI